MDKEAYCPKCGARNFIYKPENNLCSRCGAELFELPTKGPVLVSREWSSDASDRHLREGMEDESRLVRWMSSLFYAGTSIVFLGIILFWICVGLAMAGVFIDLWIKWLF